MEGNKLKTIEPREIAIGKELFAFIEKKKSFTDLKNVFLQLSTFDQKLQTQLFKFVDVLPSLKHKDSVAKILSEYIDESKFKVGFLVDFVSHLPIVRDVFKTSIEQLVAFLARTFICGKNIEEAKQTIAKLKKKNQIYTLDILGEVVLTQKEADFYYNKYIDLLQNIKELNISVKLSALVPQINKNNFEEKKLVLKHRLANLFRIAKENSATVNVDTEHYETKELFFAVTKEVLQDPEFNDFDNVGIVIQAYLKDSKKDFLTWLSWLKLHQKKITIRLVKGAYWDYEQAHALQKNWAVPVFEDKALTDLRYENLVDLALNNTEYFRPAFASHNIRSLAYILKVVEAKQISKNDFEIQMLYGMLDDLKDYFSQKGFCLRVYLPYGELLPGMSYLVRRLLENTANDSFLKQGFIDKKSKEELLQAPSIKKTNLQIKRGFQNSPEIDFSLEKNRNKFKNYLNTNLEKLNAERICALIVAGKMQESFESFFTINPAKHDQVLAKVFKANIEDCDLAIKEAKKVQKDWQDVDLKKKVRAFRETAQELERQRLFFNMLLVSEAGKAWQEADAEVCEAIDFLNYYADSALETFNTNKLRSLPGEKNTNRYSALGLSLVISPWNFPLAIMLGMTSASLICGNAVIVKPSSQTPLVAYEALMILLNNISKYCGSKYKAVLSFLPGSGAVIGDYLINHKDIACIAFTGSNETGMHINEAAIKARPVKRFIAEMGGKNPIIVERTADLDEAIPGVIYSAFGYSGQKCSACSRVIIEEEIYEDFKTRLVEAVAEVKYGDPLNFEFYSGPVIDQNAFKNINLYIDLAKKYGDVIAEGINSNEKGFFIEPIIVENLAADAIVTQEEIFGPLLAIYKAQDLDDALKLANNTEYGLTAGLFSRSPEAIEYISNNIEAGNFYINRPCTGAIVSRQAFGGHKNSSIGLKAGGPNYLLNFVLEKTITENTMRRGFADD